MADVQIRSFNQRVGRIHQKHRKMSRGFVELVERDGLLVPRSGRRQRRSFPLKGLILALVGFMVFKGLLYSQVGATTFGTRLDNLSSGSAIEKAGAWVMQADPVTIWIAEQITSFF